ncbi:MAG: N-acetylneuraminate synthase family protein [Candidatus Gastranaerophilales bacterium]|nr:N-acetylneuraminate synthase family protein [Candidatus Gastranaerophilales bacterium]
MSKIVKIGNKKIGNDQSCFIIAEIGINHNGSLELAKKLISIAHFFGCDAVKFQKRTIEDVYTPEELATPRQSVFGETNGDLKRGLEFGYEEYREIDRYCKELDIMWFASCWDKKSVDFMEQFNTCAYKIPSALITDIELLKYIKATSKPILISTGMSTIEEIDKAIEVVGLDNTVIYHCTSTYPSDNSEINLNVIKTLKERYDCPIGYSGHEKGIVSSTIAVVLGACSVERHITLDRTLWGSDQAASLEPEGLRKMVRDIRNVKAFLGDGIKKVYDSEIPIKKKLRKV